MNRGKALSLLQERKQICVFWRLSSYVRIHLFQEDYERIYAEQVNQYYDTKQNLLYPDSINSYDDFEKMVWPSPKER